MSGRAVARVVVMATAVTLMLGGSAGANEAAHKMAEKFAGSAQGADKGKSVEGKQPDKDKAEAAKRLKAEQEAAEAKKRAAALKAQAARKAAEARRKAADTARRAAEERRTDEADMLARARREAEEMRAAEEHARLTQEARRLVEEAEKERAKAEALLRGEADEKRTETADEEGLARRRTEEIRRLTERLNRVRQIREAGLAAQARRQAEASAAASEPSARPGEPPAVTSVAPEIAPVPLAVLPSAGSETNVAAHVPPPAPAPAAAGLPAAAAESSPPPPVAAAPEARPGTRVAAADTAPKSAAEIPAAMPPELSAGAPARLRETRVTVLLILEPGSYGIRRRGPRVADPILCVPDGCYISAGADHPAVFMPGRMAFKFGNTFGARAGACRNSLGCVFRGIDLGSLPAHLQPVDLHILRHDRREVHTVHTDSGCRSEPGRLSCSHGVYADDYIMWVLPDSMAAAAGPAALERAVADGLDGRRSAELAPR